MSGALEMGRRSCGSAQLPLNTGPNPTGRPCSDVQRGCHNERRRLKSPPLNMLSIRSASPSRCRGCKVSQLPLLILEKENNPEKVVIFPLIVFCVCCFPPFFSSWCFGGFWQINVASWISFPGDGDGGAPVSLRALRPDSRGQPGHHSQHRGDPGI